MITSALKEELDFFAPTVIVGDPTAIASSSLELPAIVITLRGGSYTKSRPPMEVLTIQVGITLVDDCTYDELIKQSWELSRRLWQFSIGEGNVKPTVSLAPLTDTAIEYGDLKYGDLLKAATVDVQFQITGFCNG